jgi:hypothetical protein
VKIVREKSVAGPCITLGVVLRETASRITYRDRHGEQKFISKRWPVHSEPCPSCPDHSNTKYPDDLEGIGWKMRRRAARLNRAFSVADRHPYRIVTVPA